MLGDQMRIALRPRLCGGLAILLACGSCGCHRSTPATVPAPQGSAASLPPVAIAPPPMAESPLLNTGPDATYVGSLACVECHPDQYETYARTPHSLALADIELDVEPRDDEFQQEGTGRVYRNYRQDGKLRHRESLRTPDGEELVLGDYPVRYVIGSGNHSRSYLVDIDGFLVESPLTWYASRQEWSLSPGYDKTHFGFSRPASLVCVSCHAGRVESREGSLHRLDLHEYAIGCERCHGPGSGHVEHWQSGAEITGEADLTIAHPGRLSRQLQEAICDQCHLRSATSVSVRGRDASDFRPGLRLQDFEIHYGLQVPSQEMKVAGHAEQMRLSPCYQSSESLTCTTCHDPHDKPAHEIGRTQYRQRCLSCHDSETACGLPRDTRLKRSPQDDCVSCHMPQVPIDVPHFAFTHHRIGIHESAAAKRPQRSEEVGARIGNLEPLHDLSDLSELDRDRALGLGYLDLASAAALKGNSAAFRNYRQRAQSKLEAVHRQGLRDAEVEVALAGLLSDQDTARAVQFAESALQRDSELSPDARVNANLILGGVFFASQRTNDAIQSLERLVRLRREAEDWMMLAVCRDRAGDRNGAEAALQQAAEISPARAEIHQLLAELYGKSGNTTLQQQHRKKARLFSKNR